MHRREENRRLVNNRLTEEHNKLRESGKKTRFIRAPWRALKRRPQLIDVKKPRSGKKG